MYRGVHSALLKTILALISLVAQNARAAYKALVADTLDLLEGMLYPATYTFLDAGLHPFYTLSIPRPFTSC